jgi:hypothetical protein
VVLDPGAATPVHWHPGEELVLPLVGLTEVFLEKPAVRTRIREGEFIHFYTEQEHRFQNPTEQQVRLLSIRTGISSLRERLYQSLCRRTPAPRAAARAYAECRENVIPQKTPLPNAQAIGMHSVDRQSLARYLSSVMSSERRVERDKRTLDDLANSARGFGFSRSWVYRLHQGTARVQTKDLPKLAQIYGISPVHLVDFLIPATRPTVMGQYGRLGSDSDWTRMPELSESYTMDQGLSFRISRCRLTDSDLALAHATLSPRSAIAPKTLGNRHPGWEVLIPLSGKFRLHLESMSNGIDVEAERHAFAHFSSEQDHHVENYTDEPARMLIIRVHQ